MTKKILIIAENFPPLGGAGVQRTLKFVKYLPIFGWKPVVVTGDGISRNSWAPEDKSIQNELPKELPIYRSGKSLSIESVADQAVYEHKPDLILVSMSPFSHAQVARNISQKYEIPWVADLRDPWALDEFQIWRTAWHRKKALRQMFNAIKSADLIIMNTPQAEANLLDVFPKLNYAKVTNITNGYDIEDFKTIENQTSTISDLKKTRKFTIVHTGFLHTKLGIRQQSRWWYSLIGGSSLNVRFLSRSHYYLIKALEKWQQVEPEISKFVKIILAGSLTETDKKIINDSSVTALFETPGYVNHEKSVGLACNADLLFLPMHSLDSGKKSSIVPGKTYEYMASKKPILAAVPEGDARNFLKQSGIAKICEPEDIDGMLDILKSSYSDWLQGNQRDNANVDFIEQFERRKLTKKLANFLDQTVKVTYQ